MIITIKEARKLIGKETSDLMSDEEVERTITSLTLLAQHTIEMIKKDPEAFRRAIPSGD